MLTLGTPAFSQIEIDISQIRDALDDLLPVLREGPLADPALDGRAGHHRLGGGLPRAAARLHVGEDLFVAHVPERIAAGRFLEEIATLPSIVGGVGEGSGAKAAELFEVFGAEIVQTTPVQAELAKIWTNILRYTSSRCPTS